MAERRINNFYAFSLNGGWRASFSFDSALHRKTQIRKRPTKGGGRSQYETIVERWPAIEVLRRKRPASKKNWFRTVAGLVSVSRLEVKLPAMDKRLILHLSKESPSISAILDFPYDDDDNLNRLNDWPFLATALQLDILCDSKRNWPDFISKAEIKNLKTRRSQSVSFRSFMKTYFGFETINAGDGLVINPDGLTLKGSRNAPWNDSEILPALFRYRIVDDSHLLEIEKNKRWIGSLRNYQSKVIRATANLETEDNLPVVDTPYVGLVSSVIPDKVFWHLINGTWQFIPDKGMFEGEIRGAAGATSRIRFDKVLITNNGKTLECSRGTSTSQARLSYSYEKGKNNLWNGEFDASLDGDSTELLRSLLRRYDVDDAHDLVWVQTESGPLKIPLQKDPTVEDQKFQSSSDSIFNGVMRFSEVPWIKESDDLPPAPDVSQVRYSSMTIVNADRFLASFEFEEKDSLSCKSVKVSIDEPILRLEDFFPIYLPPTTGEDIFEGQPPDLPAASEENNASWVYFLGLNLIRPKGFTPNPLETTFKINLSYQPGIKDEDLLVEGDWQDTFTEIVVPEDRQTDIQYWYKPSGLHWIPSLPLYGDPRKGNRLNQKRTYLPLRPTPEAKLILKPGVNWQVPRLLEGQFTPDRHLSGSDYSIFSWAIPELPGISFELTNGNPITISDGVPSAGKLNWVWRHDLPILDEINALRISGSDNETAESQPKDDWLDQLDQIYQLAQTKGSLLLKTLISIKKNTILKEQGKTVKVENLFGTQQFSGKATLQTKPPKASLSLVSGGQPTDAIKSTQLLKGVEASFEINFDDSKKRFQLTPTVGKGPLKIEAGTFIPSHQSIQDESILIDQTGSGPLAIKSPETGREVMVTEQDGALEKVWLWSQNELDLTTQECEVKLQFSNLPLKKNQGRWTHQSDEPLFQLDALRNFRWGCIGKVNFWGLPFQICNLIEVQFDQSNALPAKITFDGILHLQSTTSKLVDAGSQRIKVGFEHLDGVWQLATFEGSILWPFFEPSPDLSRTTSAPDTMPWLISDIRLAEVDKKKSLLFGSDGRNPMVLFKFMERTWKLPVMYTQTAISETTADDQSFSFSLIPSSKLRGQKMAPTSGIFNLRKNGSPNDSNVEFSINLTHQSNASRSILHVVFDYSISKEADNLTLRNTNILSLDASNHLITVTEKEKGAIEMSPGKLSLAINKQIGWRKGRKTFELLPGWSISDKAPLQAYLSLEVEKAPPQGEVTFAALQHSQLMIETALATPAPVSMLVSYSSQAGKEPDLNIQLTGLVKLANDIHWTDDDGSIYTHEMDAVLHKAQISGSKLAAQGTSFFAPMTRRNSTIDERGTRMIELPCLGNHRLIQKKGLETKTILKWASPQHLRIAHPSTYIEEVLLRGVTKAQLADFTAATIQTKRSTLQYRHKNLGIQFKSSEQVEHGFVGPLGSELKKVLTSNRDLMVMDATEAFWLRPVGDDVAKRSPGELWRKKDKMLGCVPSFPSDFDDSGKSEIASWTRMAIPFLTDSRQFIKSKKRGELLKLLGNKAIEHIQEEQEVKVRATYIPRDRLLILNSIDQHSLDRQPVHVGDRNTFGQVVLDPGSQERLLPYTTVQTSFEPGWLSFNDWLLSEPEELTRGIPFGATLSAIKLLTTRNETSHFACTESIPKIEGRIEKGQFKAGSYYITSPTVSVFEGTIPFRPSIHAMRQMAGTPKIFFDWDGIKDRESLRYIPPNVKSEILNWANSLPAYKLKRDVPDAPGGFSTTGKGYGIGWTVISRIKNRVQQRGPFTDIHQLLNIQGLGLDKLSDFIYAVAKSLYDFTFEQLDFEEIRVTLQLWKAGHSDGLVLASENTFLVGISNEDTWESILFPQENEDNYSKVRKRVWEWVSHESRKYNLNTSPLLRVKLLTPSSFVEDQKYYLVRSRVVESFIQKSKRKALSTKDPLTIDPRFERLPDNLKMDPLAAGPEMLAGKVYYEPRSWYEPTRPFADNLERTGLISSFTIEPKTIKRGEKVTLRWTCEHDGLLTLTDRDQNTYTIESGVSSVQLSPKDTTVFILSLSSQGELMDKVQASLVVQIPSAGSALGFTHKIAGSAPGPHNESRQAFAEGTQNEQRWLEMTRDVVYNDITRANEASLLEPGELLPTSRKVDVDALQEEGINPFFVPRVGHLFTSGRPGTLMNFRLASLRMADDHIVRRGGSWPSQFRFPRPVPLPEELSPFNPIDEEREASPTCSVRQLTGSEPFSFYELAWQDPIFNRRLLAVAQERIVGNLHVGLDRSVYGGKDVFYPEIIVLDPNLKNWKVILEVKIQRIVNLYPQVMERTAYQITPSTVYHEDFPSVNLKDKNKEPDKNRFVFEIGLNQEETHDDDFLMSVENEDAVIVDAQFLVNGVERSRVQINGLIRTDKDNWSQPQNAYGVVRKMESSTENQSDVVAFGWAPKPKIVKRRDRFRPDSWEGTFRYQDVFVKPPQAQVSYEVMSITSNGEMMIK